MTGVPSNKDHGSKQVEQLVLVIDDDSSMRAALADLFHAVGLTCQTFASGEEFLAADLPDVPSCLVLDVRLPGLSGLNLQHELSERNIEVPVIFITGHGDIPLTVQAMKAGAVVRFTRWITSSRVSSRWLIRSRGSTCSVPFVLKFQLQYHKRERSNFVRQPHV